MQYSRTLKAILVVAISITPSLAWASPWTLPNDEFVLGLDYNLQIADEEFLQDGTLQQFPLEGQFESSSIRLNGRYGFTENFEGAFTATFKQVTYESDPLLLEIPQDATRESINDDILDFSRSNAGAGDLLLHGRYNFVRSAILITTETELKVPTGYEQPAGTFAEGEEPSASTIEDDVTLGDGQTDLTQSMLFGTYIPSSRTFMRLDLGYSVRFGSPGHQAVGLFSIGQFIGENVLIFASVDSAYTLFDGESIGTSVITRSPEKQAGELTPDDLVDVPITLDRDVVKVEAGGIVSVRDIEVRVGYGQILWGRNIPRIQSFNLGLVYSIDNLTGELDEEAKDEQEPAPSEGSEAPAKSEGDEKEQPESPTDEPPVPEPGDGASATPE
ncbi:MAG: hypothetical protein ACQEVA_13910 [Myxococcota bacterium]